MRTRLLLGLAVASLAFSLSGRALAAPPVPPAPTNGGFTGRKA